MRIETPDKEVFFQFTFGIISSSNNPILWFRTYLYFSILRTVLFNSEISFSLLRMILSRDLISFLSSSLSFSRLDILVSSRVRSWEREVRLSFCSSRSFWDTTCFFFKMPSSPRNLNSSKVLIKRYFQWLLFNFERIFIPYFYSQFHDFGFKMFLIGSEAGFLLYSAHLYETWIKLFIQPSWNIIWEKMFFVLIFCSVWIQVFFLIFHIFI